MRVYLAGPMFVAAEVAYNLGLAGRLREAGFTVYCPNESEPINDKTRTDVTGQAVYLADLAALEDSNVLLLLVSEDSGANWEAGYMDCLSRRVDPTRYYGVVGLATDIRLRTPPDPAKTGVDNQAFHLNQLVVGGLQRSLGIFLDEDTVLSRLDAIRREREREGEGEQEEGQWGEGRLPGTEASPTGQG